MLYIQDKVWRLKLQNSKNQANLQHKPDLLLDSGSEMEEETPFANAVE